MAVARSMFHVLEDPAVLLNRSRLSHSLGRDDGEVGARIEEKWQSDLGQGDDVTLASFATCSRLKAKCSSMTQRG